MNDELKIHLEWWTRVQLESKYANDKLQGFYLEKSAFDKLLQSNERLIKKMYEWLLQIKMEDEVVSDGMAKWESVSVPYISITVSVVSCIAYNF